ncbi:MAG: EF-hand domain-containing protein [Planctomycetota bacterium]|nr:EF-hand domain-containing protein [Planctomycetota bacterium]
MTTQNEPNDQQRSSQSSHATEANGGKKRLFLLVGLLALALFALWYDYKVARPAVDKAYDQIAALNEEINAAIEHRRMTSVDVQNALGRKPSETFVTGRYTVEAYRWSAGMPIEIRGLSGDESPGIGLKTHDYYAVYRKDGSELAFATHFKFDLETDELTDKPVHVAAGDDASGEGAAPGMGPGGMGMGMGPGMGPGGMSPGGGGPGGGGPGGGGGFDPEAMFTERDADGDGKLTGEEIPERMLERLEAIDTDKDGSVSKEELLARMSQSPGGGGPGLGPGGEGEGRQRRPPLESSDDAPATEAAPGDASPPAESTEAPADTTTEKTEAPPETNGEAPKEESSSES